MKRPIEHKLNQILTIQDNTEQLYAFYSLIHDSIKMKMPNGKKYQVIMYKQSSKLITKYKDLIVLDSAEFKKFEKRTQNIKEYKLIWNTYLSAELLPK